jgi:hypothetical protein
MYKEGGFPQDDEGKNASAGRGTRRGSNSKAEPVCSGGDMSLLSSVQDGITISATKSSSQSKSNTLDEYISAIKPFKLIRNRLLRAK